MFSREVAVAPPQAQAPVAKPPSQDAPRASVQHLQAARSSVQEQMTKDRSRIPEISTFFHVSASSDYTAPLNECWAPFFIKRRVDFPDNLFNDWDGFTQAYMGLLPDINCAWVSWQNNVSLWDYGLQTKTYPFEPQQAEIKSVAVVKAKPGIFIDAVSHVVIIVTRSSLKLYGIALGPPIQGTGVLSQAPSRGISVYTTDMTIATPADEMDYVVGTDQGRIFMCGKADGCIFELTYQMKEGWFSRRCDLINHSAGGYGTLVPTFLRGTKPDPVKLLAVDSNRNCLYAVTAKSDVAVYYLGQPTGTIPSTAFTHVATLTNIASSALTLCPSGVLTRDSFSIVALLPTLPQESKTIHVVGVTSSGARLYFTHHRRTGSFGMPTGSGGGPTTLELVHVRGPPPVPARDLLPDVSSYQYLTPERLALEQPPLQQLPFKNVFYAAMSASIFLCSQTLPSKPFTGNPDGLLVCAPDLARLGNYASPPSSQPSTAGTLTTIQKPPPTECYSIFLIDGSTYDIAPTVAPTFILPSPDGTTLSSELITMFNTPPASFLVLSSSGINLVVRRRPVDVLRSLVERAVRNTSDDCVRQFLDVWGRDQSCAMCLAVACGNSFVTAEWVPYVAPDGPGGSLPALTQILAPGAGDIVNRAPELKVTLANAKRLFYDMGGRAVRVERPSWKDNTQQPETQITYSGRHDGLAIYLARLLRPIWNEKISRLVALPKMAPYQATNVPSAVLTTVQKELSLLKGFVEQDMSVFNSAPTQYNRASTDQDVLKAEQVSCKSMFDLVSLTIEAISFIHLVVDFNMGLVVAELKPSDQQILLTLTYEDLLVTEKGRDMARALINAIIDQQIKLQNSIDAISEILQQRCGSFCSPDDVILYKALENIRTARASPPLHRLQPLKESYRLFMLGVRTLQPEKLVEICNDYASLRYPHGAILLPLQCAKEWDPHDDGAHFYLDGAPRHDPRAEMYDRRAKAYDCVLRALTYYDELLYQATGDAVNDTQALQQAAYGLALNSDDGIFHAYLYDWFIQKGNESRLLELRTRFIEPYLMGQPASLTKSQLLWQYYVRAGRPMDAAVVLSNMASSDDPNLNLDERIQLLARAVNSAKAMSAPSYNGEGSVEFLTDLEERLEVAQLQAELYGQVETQFADGSNDRRATLQQLGTRLWTITELYQNLAIAYDLDFAKLLILHVSDHHDQQLVMDIWKRTIERAHAEGMQNMGSPESAVAGMISHYGRRLYPSEVAFPIRLIYDELLVYQFKHQDFVQRGWAGRTLADAGVSREILFEVLEILHQDAMSPPWNTPAGDEYLVFEIATFLCEWYQSESSPLGHRAASSFPAAFVEQKVNDYITQQTTDEGRQLLTELSRTVRRTY